MENSFFLKGNICHTPTKDSFEIYEKSFLMRTFPEEAKYAESAYADKAYGLFADALKKSATTRAVIFGTIHREAALCLMDIMERTGIVSYVGKVNMDRDAPLGELLSGDQGRGLLLRQGGELRAGI